MKFEVSSFKDFICSLIYYSYQTNLSIEIRKHTIVKSSLYINELIYRIKFILSKKSNFITTNNIHLLDYYWVLNT